MFNESNTVEAYVRDLLASPIKAVPANTVQEPQVPVGAATNRSGNHLQNASNLIACCDCPAMV